MQTDRCGCHFVIGNGDAHRKNFSFLTSEKDIVALSPVYDLVSSRLAIPEEDDEMALTINGKRNRFNKEDFLSFALNIGVDVKYAEKRISELVELQGDFAVMVNESTLTLNLRQQLNEIIAVRLDRLKA